MYTILKIFKKKLLIMKLINYFEIAAAIMIMSTATACKSPKSPTVETIETVDSTSATIDSATIDSLK